jgi:hypothetical protein
MKLYANSMNRLVLFKTALDEYRKKIQQYPDPVPLHEMRSCGFSKSFAADRL